jgi:hypothetical protein
MPADVHLTEHARKRIYERAAHRTPAILAAIGTGEVTKESRLWLGEKQLGEHEWMVHIDETTTAIVASREPAKFRVVVTLLTLEGFSAQGPGRGRRW